MKLSYQTNTNQIRIVLDNINVNNNNINNKFRNYDKFNFKAFCIT